MKLTDVIKAACFHGYVIVDKSEVARVQTLSFNRTGCWDAFIRRGARVEREARKKELQREGFKAVKIRAQVYMFREGKK